MAVLSVWKHCLRFYESCSHNHRLLLFTCLLEIFVFKDIWRHWRRQQWHQWSASLLCLSRQCLSLSRKLQSSLALCRSSFCLSKTKLCGDSIWRYCRHTNAYSNPLHGAVICVPCHRRVASTLFPALPVCSDMVYANFSGIFCGRSPVEQFLKNLEWYSGVMGCLTQRVPKQRWRPRTPHPPGVPVSIYISLFSKIETGIPRHGPGGVDSWSMSWDPSFDCSDDLGNR